MSKKQLDEETLRRKYKEKYPKYETLGRNLKQALEKFLDDAGIDGNVVYRVKEFDSLWDKVRRKGYKNPFDEVEDICGLRIICYYPTDLERISQIIEKEFDVKESIDKADLLEPDRFGYRSLHYVLSIKKDWLKAPNYRGLGGLVAEVQVRTILMHAWANIEHQLAYKKTEHVPHHLKRKLSQLSALFEIADERLDTLRKEKTQYREEIISEQVRKSGRFDVSQDMNVDSLQAFLDFYFPDRRKSPQLTADLLDDLEKFDISFRDLVEGFERTEDVLPRIESEAFEGREGRWAQVGIAREILDLTRDHYFQSHRMPNDVRERDKRWRARLRASEKR